MDKRVFIVHGWQGYPDEGWRPWLARELEKHNFDVFIPAMPNTNSPRAQSWVEHLAKTVEHPFESDLFVGHSLGCITILRYFETLKLSEKVGGAVLVAGFSGELKYDGYRNELASFFEKPVLWSKIKKVCQKFVAIHSDDDPYVPLKHAETFRKKLGAEVIIKEGMKHFSGDDGITELPLVRDMLLNMVE